MKRQLTLKGEHLAELSSDELVAVNGAALPTLDTCFALTGLCDRLSLDCLTGYYPSINAPCTTTG